VVYTSADDADTITLRNPQVLSTATQRSISTGVTSASSANTYGIGTVAANGVFARPISADITIPGADFGPVYTDSKTVFYYKGVKYTGYANLPLTVAGDVLVVKGSDNVVDVVHIYGDVDLTAKLTTYAVISSQPTYEYINDGKITYREVMGTTAAITNAAPGGGVYEVVEPGETGNYHLGDIVRVKQVGSEWEIDSVVEPGNAPAAATDDAVIMHGVVQNYLGSYFIVSNGIPTVFITPTLPIFDKFAADFPIANPYPKTDVEVGYEVDVLVDFQGFGPVTSYAVVITAYTPQIDYAALARTAVDNPFPGLTLGGNGTQATPYILPAATGTGITEAGKVIDGSGSHTTQTTGFLFGWGAPGALFSTDTIDWSGDAGKGPNDTYTIAGNIVGNGLAPYGQTLYNLITTSNDVTLTFPNATTIWTKADGSGSGTLDFTVTLASTYETSYTKTYYVQITGLNIS
jgi:hypothetical protein